MKGYVPGVSFKVFRRPRSTEPASRARGRKLLIFSPQERHGCKTLLQRWENKPGANYPDFNSFPASYSLVVCLVVTARKQRVCSGTSGRISFKSRNFSFVYFAHSGKECRVVHRKHQTTQEP